MLKREVFGPHKSWSMGKQKSPAKRRVRNILKLRPFTDVGKIFEYLGFGVGFWLKYDINRD